MTEDKDAETTVPTSEFERAQTSDSADYPFFLEQEKSNLSHGRAAAGCPFGRDLPCLPRDRTENLEPDSPFLHTRLWICRLRSCCEQWYIFAEDKFVIYPHKSTWFMVWEVFLIVVLMLIAFYEPVVLALVTRDTLTDIVLNGIVDICFTTDMVLTFFLAFKNARESSSEEIWEKNLVKIAKRYTAFPLSDRGRAGWFWLDLISVFPGWLELSLSCFKTKYQSSANETAHVVRVFRFLRLIRMVRMVRIAEVVEKWHAQFGWPFHLTDSCKFVVTTCLTCHWVACAWIIAEGKVTRGYISYNSHNQDSWLSALIATKGDCCSPDATQDPLCVYILSSYWAMMTLTGVGYGDITPQNNLEYTMSTAVILLAGFVWSYIVGSVFGLMSAVDPEGKAWRQNVDELNDLMSNRNLPLPFQLRLRRYMIQAKHIPRIRSQQQLLKESLSDGSQQQIAEQSRLTNVLKTKVFWVSDIEKDAVLTIAAALQPFLYAIQESINIRERMLIVQDGLMQVAGRLFARDDVYGDDSILLDTEELALRPVPTAVTYLDVRALVKEDLREVCRHFPQADSRIRRAQIRTAVYLGFIRQAKSMREGKGHEATEAEVGALSHAKSFAYLEAGDGEMYESEMRVVIPDLLDDQSRHFENIVTAMQFRIMQKQEMLMEMVRDNVLREINELQEEIAAMEEC